LNMQRSKTKDNMSDEKSNGRCVAQRKNDRIFMTRLILLSVDNIVTIKINLLVVQLEEKG